MAHLKKKEAREGTCRKSKLHSKLFLIWGLPLLNGYVSDLHPLALGLDPIAHNLRFLYDFIYQIQLPICLFNCSLKRSIEQKIENKIILIGQKYS